MNTNIKLSVVMSCYNSSKFLRETMDSILGQTYRDFEFLIWNDGSTDDTETIIQSYHDDRIQYFAAHNQGAGIARAELCKRARGEYIAVMDSDDVAYPQRLEKEVAFLDSHPDYVLVSSLIDFMDEEGNVFGQSIVPCTDAALKKVFTISNPAAMFRKEAYEKAGGFLDIRNGQDVVLWGRMAKYGKYANLPEPLLKYRIQPNSIGRSLRQENYIQCLCELRNKVIADDIVDPNDLRLMDEIWKLNMEASKELPPPYGPLSGEQAPAGDARHRRKDHREAQHDEADVRRQGIPRGEEHRLEETGRVRNNVCLEGKTILITGAAGFIGSNLAKRLLHDVKNIHVIGIDSITDYYDVNIKHERLKEIEALADSCNPCDPCSKKWTFIHDSIANRDAIERIFSENHVSVVVNLAAQAGVRYSITNPDAYVESNLIGFYNLLEACRHHEVEHLVYASSSSVYGSNKKVPYSTDDKVDNPVSLYAATKKSDELMAHAYSKLYNIPSTGLRFFTVYGPAGRPDMAYFGFTDKLVRGEKIKIFNYGNCQRDFTYIDDIVEGIVRVMQHAPEKRVGEDGLPIPPYKLYNIGNSHPENLLDFVTILQEELLRAGILSADYDFEAHKELVPMQPGDVPVTYADTTPLEQDFGYRPATPLRKGLRAFAEWYKGYYAMGK